MNAERHALSYRDELPSQVNRIAVAGVSGAGKTTLARNVAAITRADHIEIDGLYHGPRWQPRPEFLQDVQQLVAGERWVTEWQYTEARPIIAGRSDIVVWLDLPFWTVTFPRVIRRTLQRRARHETLWNDNVEPPLHTVLSNPNHIIRWAISTRHKYDKEVVPLLRASHPNLTIVHLRTPRQVRSWLDGPLTNAAIE